MRLPLLYDRFPWTYPAFSRGGSRLLGTTDASAHRELLACLEPNDGRVLEVSIRPWVNRPDLLLDSL
jgi:hypothetical protein